MMTEYNNALLATTIPTATTTVPTPATTISATAVIPTTTTVDPTTAAINPTSTAIPKDTTSPIPPTTAIIRAHIVASTAAPTKGDHHALEGLKFLAAEQRFRPNINATFVLVPPWVLEVEKDKDK